MDIEMDNIVESLIEMSCAIIFILGITFTILLDNETKQLLINTKYNLYHGCSVMAEDSE